MQGLEWPRWRASCQVCEYCLISTQDGTWCSKIANFRAATRRISFPPYNIHSGLAEMQTSRSMCTYCIIFTQVEMCCKKMQFFAPLRGESHSPNATSAEPALKYELPGMWVMSHIQAEQDLVFKDRKLLRRYAAHPIFVIQHLEWSHWSASCQVCESCLIFTQDKIWCSKIAIFGAATRRIPFTDCTVPQWSRWSTSSQVLWWFCFIPAYCLIFTQDAIWW